VSGSAPFDIDRLIHEPARLLLVSNLAVVDEADFVFLSRRTGLTAGNISSHMSRLEDAGYVRVEKGFDGRRPRTTYALTDRGRAAFERYRTQVGGLLRSEREPAPAPPATRPRHRA
jgi:DNA-binding MarR family transcriptional regulator